LSPDGRAPDDARTTAEREEDEGAIGVFPSWRWLYASVIVYTFLLVVVLYVFTVTLDAGAR